MIKHLNNEVKNFCRLYANWSGKVCIFGTGYIGRGWGYNFILDYMKKADFYCDNYVPEGVEIRDGVKTISFNELCKYKQEVLIFITASRKQSSEEIKKQLKYNEFKEIVILDEEFWFNWYAFLDLLEVNKNQGDCEKYKILLDDKRFLERKFLNRMGYLLNLDNPKTFNEKIQWLKLYDHNSNYTDLVDKYEFKNYVKKTFGEEYIIPTIGVWERVEDIDWSSLPEKFVLKCTHDSGSYIICKKKDTFDIDKAIIYLNKCMKRNYYWSDREWCYKDVKRRIIAEEYMVDEYNELRDYKFYTFGGNVKIMYIVSGRGSKEDVSNFYDLEFNLLDIKQGHKNFTVAPQKPVNFDKMIKFAEIMAKDTPHVRIDFYEVNGKLYIGEFTLYSWGGYQPFEPENWDKILGEYIDLERKGDRDE